MHVLGLPPRSRRPGKPMKANDRWYRLSNTIRPGQGTRVVQCREDALHETGREAAVRDIHVWHDRSVTLVPVSLGKGRHSVHTHTADVTMTYRTTVGIVCRQQASRYSFFYAYCTVQAIASHRVCPEQTIACYSAPRPGYYW